MRAALEYCQVPALGTVTYRFERLWPTLQQPWYFSAPSDVAVDTDGFVYVLDIGNSQVMKFTSQGQFVTHWGGQGLELGQLGGPGSIAVADDASVYVADSFNHRVQKFTSDGAFLTAWGAEGSGPGNFRRPTGVAVDSAGFVYVVDSENHRIQKFGADGQFVTEWGSQGGGNGQFFFLIATPSGGQRGEGGVAVDRDGFIYVADAGNHRVQRFTANGEYGQ